MHVWGRDWSSWCLLQRNEVGAVYTTAQAAYATRNHESLTHLLHMHGCHFYRCLRMYFGKDVDARPGRRWCWVCLVATLSRAKHESISMHDIHSAGIYMYDSTQGMHHAYMCCTQGMHGNASAYMACMTCMISRLIWMTCMTCMKSILGNSS